MIRTGQSRDARRYEALHGLGCIACVIAGHQEPCGKTEIHHVVDKGYRALSGGNQATIPLGKYHHRGEPLQGKTVRYMREHFGPSMELERKAFDETYGSQRELLALTNERLRSVA